MLKKIKKHILASFPHFSFCTFLPLGLKACHLSLNLPSWQPMMPILIIGGLENGCDLNDQYFG
jgi:hypothetical protein